MEREAHSDMRADDSVRTGLERMRDALHELENAARNLQNQNFADIVKSAAGRVHQLTQHPDLDKVQDLHGGHGTTSPNLVSFKAELANLERSGGADTDRAKELREYIKAAESAIGDRVRNGGQRDSGPFPRSTADKSVRRPGETDEQFSSRTAGSALGD
jgi:hypothetical protein